MLFPSAAPMQEIARLVEDPSWVGTSMQLGLHQPQSGMLTIVSKLFQDNALEEGEEYEYIPIHPLDPGDPGGHSTPQKNGEPAASDALPHELKQMPTGTSTVADLSPTGDEKFTGCLFGLCP